MVGEQSGNLGQEENADDPYLWLEDIEGDAAVAWVTAQNEATLARLRDAQFDADRETLRTVFNSGEHIPYIRKRGPFVYNFWTDAAHLRGVWRRTTLTSYRTDRPDWEIMLDLDALCRAEGESWVWRGCSTLPPEHRLGLVRLSRGGADAFVTREFDLQTKRFVEAGFVLPEAKTVISWIDADTVFVSTSLRPEETTPSGSGWTVRRWRRGTPFDEAPIVFAGEASDMFVFADRDFEPGFERDVFSRYISFFESEFFFEDEPGRRVKLDVPLSCWAQLHREWLIIRLRSEWATGARTYPEGALLVIGIRQFLAGDRDFEMLFEPSERRSLHYWLGLGRQIIFLTLENVLSRIHVATPSAEGWRVEAQAGLPDNASIFVGEFHDGIQGDDGLYAIHLTGFLTPSAFLLANAHAPSEPPELLKRLPGFFDAAGLEVAQYEALADDGTPIPYFQVGHKDLVLDGANPVFLRGYGGFTASMLPHYMPGTGKIWLERGGVFALANIRGGGEFGPSWHKAGMRESKRLAQDDFAAVARDLVRRGVTRPRMIAIEGQCNGGLLTANMLTRHPELFGAVIAELPVLDMRRFSKLLAGHDWIAEYGDPDNPQDWAFIRSFSPYHLAEAGREYPPALFLTTRRDDRTHPGHARKMTAKLQDLGHDALLYEPEEGGHASGADKDQSAFTFALKMAFIRWALGLGGSEAQG